MFLYHKNVMAPHVQDYAQKHAQMAVKGNAKAAKAVVKMVAKHHVVVAVVKVVKVVVMQCAKTIVLLDARLRVTAFVAELV